MERQPGSSLEESGGKSLKYLYILRLRAILFCMVALTTAATKYIFMEPASSQHHFHESEMFSDINNTYVVT